MKKFSGDTNDKLLICDRRQCDNADIKTCTPCELYPRKREKNTKILFLSEDKCDVKDNDASYFTKVQIDDDTYHIGDFAEVYPGEGEFNFAFPIFQFMNENK